jgi:solute carrier family 35 protein C2
VSHVALAAAFSALDIGLSQWSFEYITISLYTMTKTTSIIFILIFAIFLKLEEKVSTDKNQNMVGIQSPD